MMRGFDMKATPHGIDLLIARDFPTTRDYVQGLGRVGRYSEPSGRFKLTTRIPFDTVNLEEEIRRSGLIGKKVDEKVQRQPKPTVTAQQQQLPFQPLMLKVETAESSSDTKRRDAEILFGPNQILKNKKHVAGGAKQ